MLINDLLDFSQIINGKLRINWEKVPVLQIVKKLSNYLNDKFKTKDLNSFMKLKILKIFS